MFSDVYLAADVDFFERLALVSRPTLSQENHAQCIVASINVSISGKYFPYVRNVYKIEGDGKYSFLASFFGYNEAD